jgi:hypothetical protein
VSRLVVNGDDRLLRAQCWSRPTSWDAGAAIALRTRAVPASKSVRVATFSSVLLLGTTPRCEQSSGVGRGRRAMGVPCGSRPSNSRSAALVPLSQEDHAPPAAPSPPPVTRPVPAAPNPTTATPTDVPAAMPAAAAPTATAPATAPAPAAPAAASFRVRLDRSAFRGKGHAFHCSCRRTNRVMTSCGGDDATN